MYRVNKKRSQEKNDDRLAQVATPKSQRQSFSGGSQQKFARRVEGRASFAPQLHRAAALNATAIRRSPCFTAKAQVRATASASDAFLRFCIYNEEREIFAGA
jgi:hypothetical protein